MADETETSKKARKTKRVYFNAAGETTDRVKADSIGFQIDEVNGQGRSLKRKYADYPDAVQNCAKGFGFVTSLGNTVGKKDADFEDLLARDEVFMNGEWAEAGEAGPRISILAQAIVKAAAASGKTYEIDKITAKLKAMDDASRKSMKDDPAIASAFADIQLEAAKARAAEAKKAAKGATSSVLDSLGD
jgi:hypothetical protein